MTTALSPVRSVDWSWMANPERGCAGQRPELFFPIEVDDVGDEYEPAYPPPETKVICDHCPVRHNCLEFALATDQEAGVWGSMTTYQREQISKPRHRKSCPDCGSHDVITERSNEICLPCGLSWPVI